MTRREPAARRSGAAAVEFAVVMNFVLVPMLIGVWSVGRLVYVHEVVASAAREGARLAAQAVTISSDGSQTRIRTTIDPPPASPPTGWAYGDPNVKAAVYTTLVGAGLDGLAWNDVVVEFKYLNQPTVTRSDGSQITATEGPTTTNPNPYTAVQGQRFTVKVSLDAAAYRKVAWTTLGSFVGPPAVSFTVEWRMMVDIPFYVNQTLPQW